MTKAKIEIDFPDKDWDELLEAEELMPELRKQVEKLHAIVKQTLATTLGVTPIVDFKVIEFDEVLSNSPTTCNHNEYGLFPVYKLLTADAECINVQIDDYCRECGTLVDTSKARYDFKQEWTD